MIVTALTVGPFAENCYLVADEDARAAVLVDPGDESETIIDAVEASRAELRAIWLTHAHVDHIGGIAGVLRRWRVPVYLHPLDRELYDDGAQQAAMFDVPFEQPPAPDRELAEGDVVEVGSLRFDVLHVPGHAPGHVAFRRRDILLSGDVLFAGSIGRTDLPLSSPEDLERSLARLATFAPETQVLAGHGPPTTIGVELLTNPFLTGHARLVRR